MPRHGNTFDVKGFGQALDLRGFAEGFREAFDMCGLVDGFREALDIRGLMEGAAAGLRDGSALLMWPFRKAANALHSRTHRAEAMSGVLFLQRLAADMAGGGGAAVRALHEIRHLMRPYNPRIDAIPDKQIPAIVKRIIDDLEKPMARPEDFAGAVARALEEAQARAAELEFGAAAAVLDAALRRTEAEDRNRAYGRAALLAERGRVARLQLHYTEAARFYRQAAAVVSFDDVAAWKHLMETASGYYAQGEEFGDNDALREAIEVYQRALDLVPRERVPLDWAVTQNNLGNALQVLGERESGTERLEEAAAAYRAGREERTRKRVPLERAMTQSRRAPAVNAMELLEQDHREVEELFDQFDELEDEKDKQELAQIICMMLVVHTQIEEEIFYPAARRATGDNDALDEAVIEHAGAKYLISEIKEMQAGEDLFDAKIKVLGEQIKHHVREEEEELFPELETSQKMDFEAVGAQLQKRKEELLKEIAGSVAITRQQGSPRPAKAEARGHRSATRPRIKRI